MNEVEERALNCRQTQWLLGNISRTTLDKMRKEGLIKGWREGGRVMFSYREIMGYIRAKKEERDRELKSISIRHLNFELENRGRA